MRVGADRHVELAAGTGVSGAAATAYFEDTLHETGWGVFEVSTTKGSGDADQAFAAGYLEGYLTGEQTAANYANMWHYFFDQIAAPPVDSDSGGPFPVVFHNWLAEQSAYARTKINAETEDPYWRQAGLVFDQFDGQVAGFTAFLAAESPPCGSAEDAHSKATDALAAIGGASPWEVATLLNSVGDMVDLQAALAGFTAPYDPSQAREWLFERSMCSAIFKVLPDLSDVIMGHSSWFTYSATNRVYKHYHLHMMPEHTAASSLSFSSYAGYQTSLDDFYMLSSGLVMIQTSIGILDPEVHRQATPNGLLAWQRVRIAHALSNTGEEWYHHFRRENSGTYNNQYMILDMNRFTPGQPLAEGLFFVVEQVPGLVEGRDATHLLEYGYFPSFNVPYFTNVWERAGYKVRYENTSNPSRTQLTHALASRAQLFRRDHAGITDLDGVVRVLTSNDYLNDPLQNGDPVEAICARGDLMPDHPKASGCYDVKATRVSLARNLTSVARSGPTHGTNSNLPTFDWEGPFSSTPHRGLPQRYNFPLRTMRPQWLSGPTTTPVVGRTNLLARVQTTVFA